MEDKVISANVFAEKRNDLPREILTSVHELARGSADTFSALKTNHRKARAEAEAKKQEADDACKRAYIKIDELITAEFERHEKMLEQLRAQRDKVDEFLSVKMAHYEDIVNYHKAAEELL